MVKFTVLCCALLAHSSFVFGKYSDDLPRCNYGDNVCIPKAINQVLKTIKNGKDEIGLPVFEPLNIKRLDIIQDPSSTIAIKLTFRDVDIYGISFAEVYKTVGFDKDPSKSKYEVHARVPKLKINAKYVIDGKVLILPIQGNGNSTLHFDNVDINFKFKADKIEKNGEIFGNITKIKLRFTTTKLQLHFENLFNGNKALGDNMNLFLNENWEIILQELKPGVTDILSKIVLEIIGKFFTKNPYNTLFLDG